MTALATYGTSGTSPSVEAFLDRLTIERWKSLRTDKPEMFEHLPPRFVLIRRGGAWWVVDTAYRFEPRRDDRR